MGRIKESTRLEYAVGQGQELAHNGCDDGHVRPTAVTYQGFWILAIAARASGNVTAAVCKRQHTSKIPYGITLFMRSRDASPVGYAYGCADATTAST